MGLSIVTAKIIRDSYTRKQADVDSLIVSGNGRALTLSGKETTASNTKMLAGVGLSEIKNSGNGIKAGEYGKGEVLHSSAHRRIRMLLDCSKSNESLEFMVGVTHEEDIIFWGKSDSSWALWGENEEPAWITTIYNPKKGISKIKEMQPFVEGFYVLYEDGDLYAMGRYYSGCIGIGNSSGVLRDLTLCFTNVEKFIVSGNHAYDWQNNFTIALRKDGTVWGCGENSSGQLGLGHTTDQNNWVGIPIEFEYHDEAVLDIVAFDAIYGGSIIRTDRGLLYATGRNNYGELGLGDKDNRSRFTLIESLKRSSVVDVKVTQGGRHGSKRRTDHSAIALTDNGQIFTWGCNHYGTLATDDLEDRTTPTPINEADNAKKIYAPKSWRGTLAYIDNDGNLYLSGPKWGYRFGTGDNKDNVKNFYEVLGNVKELYTGTGVHETQWLSFLALTHDNQLFAWGANERGNAGINTNSWVKKIVEVPFNHTADIKDIQMYGDDGRVTTAILLNDGRVFSAGNNNYCQVTPLKDSGTIQRFIQVI